MVLKRGEGERCRERERERERCWLFQSNPNAYNLTIKCFCTGPFDPDWHSVSQIDIYIYKLIRAEAVLRENLIEQFLGRFSSGVRQALDVFIQ